MPAALACEVGRNECRIDPRSATLPSFDPGRVTTLTLDCYGTLIDWETGIIDALRPLLARHGVSLSDDEVIAAAREIEEPLCQPPFRLYRAVLAGVVEGFGRRFGSRSRAPSANCWPPPSRPGGRSRTRWPPYVRCNAASAWP